MLNAADRTSSEPDSPSDTTPPTVDRGPESGDRERKEQTAGSNNGRAEDLLPPEIWTEVCRKLRQLDRAEAARHHERNTWQYPELSVRTRHWDVPVCTSRSLVPLSKTCRFLYRVSTPLLLEAVRIYPRYGSPERGLGDFDILRQMKALGRLPHDGLQQIKDLGVELRSSLNPLSMREELLLNQLNDLLSRLQHLRHLTLVRIPPDDALMRRITALPLQELRLWKSSPSPSASDISACISTRPQVRLRSLIVEARIGTSVNEVGCQWVDKLATGTMVDLLLDVGLLPPNNSALLEHLRSLTLRGLHHDPNLLDKLSTFFSRAPKLEDLYMWLDAPTDPSPARILILPAISRFELYSSWIPYLVLGTSVTRIKVLVQTGTTPEQIIRFMSQSAESVKYLSLQYNHSYPEGAWTGDALQDLVRLFPDLIHFSFRLEDPTDLRAEFD
ncbi:hypothetical protein M407DRAFT_23925 [Tulasnella calospora MUT 4182]|uniref:F-box domain-containing protein n=1 Tax=Tulasnella calospora MUT 4182 TaxID=1051891 RepID=A0A0C3LZR6_9AGAM|nr:hypothetical protein M407DRAFT_23925 [Tulasnella calospora MUT 4182]